MQSGLASKAKNLLMPAGRRPYVVPFGLYRGIRLELDLRRSFQIYAGLWELETSRYLSRYDDYAWAVDIGAGAGELCLFLLKRRPAVRTIFAVEPDAAEAERLKANLRLNPSLDTGRIVLLQRLVGAGAGELRLDELRLGELPLRDLPGLLKIDVDGHELQVLEGAATLLQRPNVDILLETHSRALEAQSIATLAAAGFHTHIIKNGWYRRFLPEQRPVDHNRWLWATNRPRA